MEESTKSKSDAANDLADWGWRSNAYAWFVVVVLTLAFTLSMIDRMILTLLVEPIKRDLGLSDTELSLLHGFAFTLLYVICGFPLGRLADRHSRRALAGVSVFSWSLMTTVCGVAQNFWQLFLARVGVGIGEAGLTPAGASLISDYFPKEQLARPTAFFSIGGSAGTGLAFIFGGAVVHLVSDVGSINLPFIGYIYAWQAAFFIVGAPGMLFALLFVFVREPQRRGRSAEGVASIASVFQFLKTRHHFFTAHFLGASLAAMVLIGIHSWMPTFFIRTYGWDAQEAGYVYGITVLVSGISGLLCAGHLVERQIQKNVADPHLQVALHAVLLGIVPAIAAPLLPQAWMTVPVIGIAVFFIVIPIALAPVALQIVVPNDMRGQAFAVYLFVLSILGYGTGPTVVAVTTDFIFQAENLVRYSLVLVTALVLPLSAYFIFRAKRFSLPAVKTSQELV